MVVLGVMALAAGVYALHESRPPWYARLLYPLDHVQAIRDESERHRLDPALVAAVIYRESGFDAAARSRAGAVGLMQLLPSTARYVADQRSAPPHPPDDLRNPRANIAYGTWLLRSLIDRFGSVPAALAAYNAGDGTLMRWRREAREAGRDFVIPRDVPFPETREFVGNVLEARAVYREAFGDRLGPAPPRTPPGS